MNDDLDRWINLEGPPPVGVRELLDAACDVPEMTIEQEARLDKRLYAALAEDRRRRARRRATTRALGSGLGAACLAAGVVLALRLAAPSDVADTQGARPKVTTLAAEQHGSTESTVPPEAPSASATAGPHDAAHGPGRHPRVEPLRPRLRR